MADDNKLASGGQAVLTGQFGDKTLASVFEDLKTNVQPKTNGWLAWSYDNTVDVQDLLAYLQVQPYVDKSRARQHSMDILVALQQQGAMRHVWDSNPTVRDTKMFMRYSSKPAEDVKDQYDVVVIGGGTAGISAMGACASFGAKAVMIEKNRVGGDCTWSGCVPSKSLIKASHTVYASREAQEFGVGEGKPRADMQKVKDYVWDKINHIAKHDLDILKEKNIPLRYGTAKFTDPHTIELRTKEGEVQKIHSKTFILALGAVAAPPPMEGLDQVPYWTYETIFDLFVLPRRMCVVGGGVIGVEMAQSFARLGAEVTIVASQLLPKEPKKVHEALAKQFEKEGIKLVSGRGHKVSKVEADGSVLDLAVKQSSGELVTIQTDLLMIATGRRPFTNEMNLAAAGVKVDPKTKLICVTDTLKTDADHIYACGDCCTLQQFTHYASQMGVWAARNMLLPGSVVPTHVVPRATFSEPEVASVGLTEDEARAKGYEIWSQSSTKNERAICEHDQLGFIDVYLDKAGLVVGACIMNNRAGELLSEILICMEHKIPFTKLSLREIVHPYPTYSWATGMLATEIDGKKFEDSTAGSLVRWYVSRPGSI